MAIFLVKDIDKIEKWWYYVGLENFSKIFERRPLSWSFGGNVPFVGIITLVQFLMGNAVTVALPCLLAP